MLLQRGKCMDCKKDVWIIDNACPLCGGNSFKNVRYESRAPSIRLPERGQDAE